MIKTGDRVICIDASNSSVLIEGREYVAGEIETLCCEVVIEVGLYSTNDIRCNMCSTHVIDVGELAYFRLDRFRKVEEKVNYVKQEIKLEEPILN